MHIETHTINLDDEEVGDTARLATVDKLNVAAMERGIDPKRDTIALDAATIFGHGEQMERLSLRIDGIGRRIVAVAWLTGGGVNPRPTLGEVAYARKAEYWL